MKKSSVGVLRYVIAKLIQIILTKYKVIKLKEKLESAQNSEDCFKLAKIIDQLEGKEIWKMNKISSLYDYERIEDRYRSMKQMRQGQDIRGLVQCLRQDLLKNLGGIASPQLYSYCHFGTKRLIEKYHNEVIECVRFIYYYKGQKLNLQQKLEFFAETRHSFGRTALLLSGGATFGRFHIGVIKGLCDQDLMPRILCGSSVGSIIAAFICSRRYEDIDQVLNLQPYIDNPLLKYKINSLGELIINLINGKAILDSDHLKGCLVNVLNDLTFKEIHDKYKWTLNISVTDANKRDECRLLNYLTAPNVVIWSAVLASAAIPSFFEPVELMMKHEGQTELVPYHVGSRKVYYIDGSIGGDLPMQRMSELFNVNSFIVSQVNPHVVPFVAEDGGGILESKIKRQFTVTFKAIMGNEVKHLINQMVTLGCVPLSLQRLSYLITQQYKGHVTIVPKTKLSHYKNILINPSPEDYIDAIQTSYNSTLQKISIVRAIFGVEREFDRYYLRLKHSLKGANNHLLTDPNLIDYAIKRTYNREHAWEEQENVEYENLDNQHNELICYISKKHRNNIDIERMEEILTYSQNSGTEFNGQQMDLQQNDLLQNDEKLQKYYYYNSGQQQQKQKRRGGIQKVDSMATIMSAHSQEFFGSEAGDNQMDVDQEIEYNQTNQFKNAPTPLMMQQYQKISGGLEFDQNGEIKQKQARSRFGQHPEMNYGIRKNDSLFLLNQEIMQ
eukprot:403375331